LIDGLVDLVVLSPFSRSLSFCQTSNTPPVALDGWRVDKKVSWFAVTVMM